MSQKVRVEYGSSAPAGVRATAASHQPLVERVTAPVCIDPEASGIRTVESERALALPPSPVSEVQVISIAGGGSSVSGAPCRSVKWTATSCTSGAAGLIFRWSWQLVSRHTRSLRATPPTSSTPLVTVAGSGVLGDRGVATSTGVETG